jgi:hypothetical protein
MCEFASFILTKDYEFWGPTDSHSDIIEHHEIHEDGARGPNVLRVEIAPPSENPRAPLEQWRYQIDQDKFPEWHTEDPAHSEERARLALTRRAACERWMVDLTAANSESAAGGYASTVSGGARSTVSGGYASTVSGGARSMVSGGARSTVSGGDASTVSGGDDSTVSGGDDSIVIAKYWDGSRYRVAVGYIGEEGIESGVAYRVTDGKLKRKDPA